MAKRTLWWMLCLASIVAAVYVLRQCFENPMDSFSPRWRSVYEDYRVRFYLNRGCSGGVLITGPFLFLRATQKPKLLWLHRWTGRFYMLAGLVGAIAGLLLVIVEPSASAAKLGWAAFYGSWLITAGSAFSAARDGDIKTHQRSMLYNYALTFSAVTILLQWWLVRNLMHQPLAPFVNTVLAWSGWLPNLVIAQRMSAATGK